LNHFQTLFVCVVGELEVVPNLPELSISAENLLPGVHELRQKQHGQRAAAYAFLKCIDHAMAQGLCQKLDDYCLPANMVARPLLPSEVRVRHPETRQWVIVNKDRKTFMAEAPLHVSPRLLVLHLDQCSIGRSGVFFACQRRRLLAWPIWDIHHRCWNDILQGASRAQGRFRRAILFLTVVCNIPYGPWLESKFFRSRQ